MSALATVRVHVFLQALDLYTEALQLQSVVEARRELLTMAKLESGLKECQVGFISFGHPLAWSRCLNYPFKFIQSIG